MSEATVSKRPRRSRTIQWPMLVWLTAIWVALWGDLSVANVVAGVLLGLLVTVVFPLPPIVYGGRLHPVAFGWLIVKFLFDLVVASVQVTVAAFAFWRPVRNAVIEVRLRTHSDLYLTLTAEMVTLVPGSMVVEARRGAGVLYVHVLGVRTGKDIEAARAGVLKAERRLVRAVGSRAEIAELDTVEVVT